MVPIYREFSVGSLQRGQKIVRAGAGSGTRPPTNPARSPEGPWEAGDLRGEPDVAS